MCDLLDNPGGMSVPPSSRKSSNAESLGLTLGNSKFQFFFFFVNLVVVEGEKGGQEG